MFPLPPLEGVPKLFGPSIVLYFCVIFGVECVLGQMVCRFLKNPQKLTKVEKKYLKCFKVVTLT